MSKKRHGSSKRRVSVSQRAQLLGLCVLALATAAVVTVAVAPKNPIPAATSASAPEGATAMASPTAKAPKISVPANASVLIVGDSYTEGVGADNKQQGWAHVAGAALNLSPRIDGVGGTGFAWGGGADNSEGRQYSVRLRAIAAEQTITPDVLILQGGQNDSLLRDDQEVSKAVTSTVDEARNLWPNLQVLVMGPSAPEPLATNLIGTNAAVREGAANAGVPFIDAAGEHWFTAQNSESFHTDGNHVNTAGHKLIADNFSAHWQELTN